MSDAIELPFVACPMCDRPEGFGTGDCPGAATYDCAEYVVPLLRAQLAAATARASELEKQVALYRKGYEARGEILAAYRTGGRPSAKALDAASDVATKLGLLATDGEGGKGG